MRNDIKANKPIFHEIKSGGVLLKKEKGNLLVALVHRPRYDDWTLPKGHITENESLQDAAIREISEETGYKVGAQRLLTSIDYDYERDNSVFLSTTHYFLMKITGKSKNHTSDREVDEVIWISIEDAVEKLSYSTEQYVLILVYEKLKEKQKLKISNE